MLPGGINMKIESSLNDGVLTLTIVRPEAANALNEALQLELQNVLARGQADPSVKAAVLAAAGPKAFSSGADLREYSELPWEQAALRRREVLMDTLYALLRFDKPLVASVQAPAVGAGAMLALACDEIVMNEATWLSFPESQHDMPSPVGIVMIERRGAIGQVQRLIQRAQRLSAGDALAAGVVDAVCPVQDLAAQCDQTALELTQVGAHAYAQNKRWRNDQCIAALAQAALAATAADERRPKGEH